MSEVLYQVGSSSSNILTILYLFTNGRKMFKMPQILSFIFLIFVLLLHVSLTSFDGWIENLLKNWRLGKLKMLPKKELCVLEDEINLPIKEFFKLEWCYKRFWEDNLWDLEKKQSPIYGKHLFSHEKNVNSFAERNSSHYCCTSTT